MAIQGGNVIHNHFKRVLRICSLQVHTQKWDGWGREWASIVQKTIALAWAGVSVVMSNLVFWWALCVALMALDWLWWRAWAPFVAVVVAAVCVAGVALGDIDLHFAWQAWHLATSTFTLRGSCGTYGTGLALVAHTHNSSTQLCHTQLFHTQLCHMHLFHTQSFTHNFVTYNCFTHNTLTYTNLHTHTALSHTALSPNLSCTISFPSCLSHLIFTSACDHWKKLICGVIRSFNCFHP